MSQTFEQHPQAQQPCSIVQAPAARNTIKAISQSGEVSSPAPSEAGFSVDTTNNVKVRHL